MVNHPHLKELVFLDYPNKIDIVAMVIDNECSRFTKAWAPLTAKQLGLEE